MLLELLWRAIAESGVKSLSIIIPLDELLDVIPQVIEISVLTGINLFPLERFNETLTTSVVVWVGRSTHA
jgi:hypothetical protein